MAIGVGAVMIGLYAFFKLVEYTSEAEEEYLPIEWSLLRQLAINDKEIETLVQFLSKTSHTDVEKVRLVLSEGAPVSSEVSPETFLKIVDEIFANFRMQVYAQIRQIVRSGNRPDRNDLVAIVKSVDIWEIRN